MPAALPLESARTPAKSPDFALAVAPMEGVTTFPMRLWLHLAAQPELMTTPFLRVTQVYPTTSLPADFAPELGRLRGVLPYQVTPQLLAIGRDSFLRASDLLPPELAPVIEINCGCPSPNAMGKLAGSGLLQNPETFGQLIHSLAAALGPGRLAVKMRLGYHDAGELPQLLAALQGAPLARLTVHGRTRADGYRGQARWDLTEVAAATTGLPTHASGDVLGTATLADLRRQAPRLNGAMIGRGLLRNPWIFEELRSGTPVALTAGSLANALLAFALLDALWQTAPEKLLTAVGNGRLPQVAGAGREAWQRVSAYLSTLYFGYPLVITPAARLPDERASQRLLSRLRWLWSHLRTSLPPPFWDKSLARAPHLPDFFQQLSAVAMAHAGSEPMITLRHRREWDPLFANARGGAAAPAAIPEQN